jgi:hypothetical protein
MPDIAPCAYAAPVIFAVAAHLGVSEDWPNCGVFSAGQMQAGICGAFPLRGVRSSEVHPSR